MFLCIQLRVQYIRCVESHSFDTTSATNRQQCLENAKTTTLSLSTALFPPLRLRRGSFQALSAFAAHRHPAGKIVDSMPSLGMFSGCVRVHVASVCVRAREMTWKQLFGRQCDRLGERECKSALAPIQQFGSWQYRFSIGIGSGSSER